MNQRGYLLHLEEENNRIEQIVADLTLDKQILQEVLKKMPEAPAIKAIGGKADRRFSGVNKKSLRGGLYASVSLVL